MHGDVVGQYKRLGMVSQKHQLKQQQDGRVEKWLPGTPELYLVSWQWKNSKEVGNEQFDHSLSGVFLCYTLTVLFVHKQGLNEEANVREH